MVRRCLLSRSSQVRLLDRHRNKARRLLNHYPSRQQRLHLDRQLIQARPLLGQSLDRQRTQARPLLDQSQSHLVRRLNLLLRLASRPLDQHPNRLHRRLDRHHSNPRRPYDQRLNQQLQCRLVPNQSKAHPLLCQAQTLPRTVSARMMTFLPSKEGHLPNRY
jgi:hypothetical protein